MRKAEVYRSAEIKLIGGAPALLLRKSSTLVIGDLHIGKELKFIEAGMHLPLASKKMAREVMELYKRENARRIIILGDVKESIGWPLRDEYLSIASFFNTLADIPVTIVKGNHDAHLAAVMARLKIDVEIKNESITEKVALLHGHAMPSREALNKKYLILGHGHTAAYVGEGAEKAWLVVTRHKRHAKHAVSSLIIVPAFNPLIIGTTPNIHGRAFLPVLRGAFSIADGRLYGLDGRFIRKAVSAHD